MSSYWFTIVFLAALFLALILRGWLSYRQSRHVAAHRDVVPTAFAERITLPAHQKAADYTLAKQAFGRIDASVDAVILLAWTLGGGLALLMTATGWLPVGALWQDVALLVAVALIGGILGLPFSYYSTFGIEARFGFNRTSRTLWLVDLVKSTLLSLLIGIPLIALLLWLMRAAGTLWWLWAWFVFMGVQLLMLVIYPTLIAPLFNKFEPLPEGSTRTRIEALLARCGFTASGLFVMDGSRRSGHGNAYFTGLGRAKRIVFFDTLFNRLNEDEIEAVLAHELGHFRRHHIKKRIVFSALLSLAFLALLAWLLQQPWFFNGLGIPSDQVATAMTRPGVALSLFMLVLPVFMFLFTPLGAAYSRRHEFEADAYAATHASATALEQALVRLYEDNAATLTPDPIHSAFYDSHPPAALRIAHLRSLRNTV
ncbi:MAG: M48 family metallopeptidase [Burkholderiales bacterium]|jgi:STE24 endopeptidase|nr:M48 family metallopeptidase [Burkholderiales bacterium]